ncbi:hypothetical protein PC120_g22326 [Phytophthora cactorum]|nr:hypothetical protein PC120_g22326 [Phytophthora cactorum]
MDDTDELSAMVDEVGDEKDIAEVSNQTEVETSTTTSSELRSRKRPDIWNFIQEYENGM